MKLASNNTGLYLLSDTIPPEGLRDISLLEALEDQDTGQITVKLKVHHGSKVYSTWRDLCLPDGKKRYRKFLVQGRSRPKGLPHFPETEIPEPTWDSKVISISINPKIKSKGSKKTFSSLDAIKEMKHHLSSLNGLIRSNPELKTKIVEDGDLYKILITLSDI